LTRLRRRGELVRRDGQAELEPQLGVTREQVCEPSVGVVSLRAEVPEALLTAMRAFIEQHPNWDQYRLFQAALAGFLVQHGMGSREVTRCYLANLFPSQSSWKSCR
jgi:hypothetical protein